MIHFDKFWDLDMHFKSLGIYMTQPYQIKDRQHILLYQIYIFVKFAIIKT